MASNHANELVPANADANDEIPPALQAVKESLECQICGGFFQAAVTVADAQCGHSFCAECIRNTFRVQMRDSIARKRMCPICRCPCGDERKLIPNRALQEAVAAFQNSLPKMLAMAKVAALVPTTSTSASAEKHRKESPILTPSPPSRAARSSRRKASAVHYSDDSHDNDVDVKELSLPAKRPRVSLEATSATTQVQHVEPPITTRKPLTATYHSKKLKDLRALCQQEGLSTRGTEQELIRRHQDFIILWNCEVDNTVNPKTPSQIRKILAEREAARAKEQTHAQFGGAAQQHKGMQNFLEKGTSGTAEMDQKISSGFNNLIAQMKERMAQEKKKKQQQVEKDIPSAGDAAATAAAAKNTADILKQSAEFMKVEAADSSCPALVNPKNRFGTSGAVHLASTDINSLAEAKRTMTVTAAPAPTATPDVVPVNGKNHTLLTQESIGTLQGEMTQHTVGMKKQSTLLDRLVVTRPRVSTQNSSNEDAFSTWRPRRSIMESWSCEVCTFLNENRKGLHAKCEMCGKERSKIL